MKRISKSKYNKIRNHFASDKWGDEISKNAFSDYNSAFMMMKTEAVECKKQLVEKKEYKKIHGPYYIIDEGKIKWIMYGVKNEKN